MAFGIERFARKPWHLLKSLQDVNIPHWCVHGDVVSITVPEGPSGQREDRQRSFDIRRPVCASCLRKVGAESAKVPGVSGRTVMRHQTVGDDGAAAIDPPGFT